MMSGHIVCFFRLYNSSPLTLTQRGYRLAKNLWFRRALRAFRISVLGATLYQLGRMSGIHDFVRDPNKHTSGFVVSALNSMDARYNAVYLILMAIYL